MKDQSVGRRPRGLGRITSLHIIPVTRERDGSNKQEKENHKWKRDFCLWGRRVQLVAFTAVDLFFMRNAVVAGFGSDL